MDLQQFNPVTMCLSKVTLAAGTTTTLSNTGTIVYAIRGKAYSQAALNNTPTPVTDFATGNAFLPIPIPATAPNLAAGYGSIFMVGLDHAGTLRVIQGTIVPLDSSGNFINAPQFGALEPSGSVPTTSGDFCPIGYIVVKLGATAVATWTFGTNNLSGVTGVTYTFVDLISETDRPQVS
jgi:hypothetical protein